jgi:hypothetical protein
MRLLPIRVPPPGTRGRGPERKVRGNRPLAKREGVSQKYREPAGGAVKPRPARAANSHTQRLGVVTGEHKVHPLAAAVRAAFTSPALAALLHGNDRDEKSCQGIGPPESAGGVHDEPDQQREGEIGTELRL